MAWPKAVVNGVAVVVTVGAIIGGIAAAKQLLVGDIEQQITRLENNIPSKVREGVRDALAGDEVVRIQVDAIIDDKLQKLISDNTEALVGIRDEMAKSRESLTAAIQSLTKQLSKAIGRLEGEMTGVRAMQEIMMLRLLNNVPEDPEDYLKKGIWKDPFFNVAPVWVIERGDYDMLEAMAPSDADNKILYRMEAVKGTPE